MPVAKKRLAAAPIINLRLRWRIFSRCFKSLKLTPSTPAANLSSAFCLPSLFARASAAKGSVGVLVSSPCSSISYFNASGKHSSSSIPGLFAPLGSPSTIIASTRLERPSRLKCRISWFTHIDLAERGEHITIR